MSLSVGKGKKFISLHVVYMIKSIKEGTKKMKGKIYPLVNCDKEKDNICKHSAKSQLHAITLLLILATSLHFSVGCEYVKGAFLESGDILPRYSLDLRSIS